ncbi:MAG: hypothetical protein FJZ59_02785 [Chlamydiae bacterium]|jgi:hypothetical protein|nr:hypothetical protein [Chlamydiota bacterium]
MEAVSNFLVSAGSFVNEASNFIQKQTGINELKQIKIAAVIAGVVGAIFAIAGIGSLVTAPISSAVFLLSGTFLAIFCRDVFVVCENEEKKENTLKGRLMSLLTLQNGVSLEGTILLKRLV